MNAYDCGIAAFIAGANINDNPYVFFSDEHRNACNWAHGFNAERCKNGSVNRLKSRIKRRIASIKSGKPINFSDKNLC